MVGNFFPDHWQKKPREIMYNIRQGNLRQPSLAEEGIPLKELLFVFVKLVSQRNRDFRGDCSPASYEGINNRLGEDLPFESEMGLQPVQVVKIFHAAIVDSQGNSRFQLFGNDCFRRIGQETGTGEGEEFMPLPLHRSGSDGIAETDIDLNLQNGSCEMNGHTGPNSTVGDFIPDRGGDNFAPDETVRWFNIELSEFRENMFDCFLGCFSISKKVQIPGRSMPLSFPDPEQLRPFENKALPILTPAKPIEEASCRILFHQGIEWHTLLS